MSSRGQASAERTDPEGVGVEIRRYLISKIDRAENGDGMDGSR